jgi:hypothetical protein
MSEEVKEVSLAEVAGVKSQSELDAANKGT